ncbi:uncharacterized protein TM35_000241030 [Trypanosoma theileri]|uniref:Uncharacterized protein n=1 Tax=Trypanosoma theileri TaxID=67003 RepID=A0A1X0NR36_9TRYP|nr:uncharacterized protein TM35_000241030 [Trypanosoma theileri]ORC86953.1 hypothetical protein TM35_000241030 [Trypanosoma theileri]
MDDRNDIHHERPDSLDNLEYAFHALNKNSESLVTDYTPFYGKPSSMKSTNMPGVGVTEETRPGNCENFTLFARFLDEEISILGHRVKLAKQREYRAARIFEKALMKRLERTRVAN